MLSPRHAEAKLTSRQVYDTVEEKLSGAAYALNCAYADFMLKNEMTSASLTMQMIQKLFGDEATADVITKEDLENEAEDGSGSTNLDACVQYWCACELLLLAEKVKMFDEVLEIASVLFRPSFWNEVGQNYVRNQAMVKGTNLYEKAELEAVEEELESEVE